MADLFPGAAKRAGDSQEMTGAKTGNQIGPLEVLKICMASPVAAVASPHPCAEYRQSQGGYKRNGNLHAALPFRGSKSFEKSSAAAAKLLVDFGNERGQGRPVWKRGSPPSLSVWPSPPKKYTGGKNPVDTGKNPRFTDRYSSRVSVRCITVRARRPDFKRHPWTGRSRETPGQGVLRAPVAIWPESIPPKRPA